MAGPSFASQAGEHGEIRAEKKQFRPFVKNEHNEHNVRIDKLDIPALLARRLTGSVCEHKSRIACPKSESHELVDPDLDSFRWHCNRIRFGSVVDGENCHFLKGPIF